MIPRFYELVNDFKVYPFGEAPAKCPTPYAVWTSEGSLERYLNCPDTMPSYSIQVDCYGECVTSVRQFAQDLRAKVEPVFDLVFFSELGRDEETALYRMVLRFEGLQQ